MNHYILEIGELIINCDDAKEEDWNTLTIVYDITDSHAANSGFAYRNNKCIPIAAGYSGKPPIISNKIREFRDAMAEQTGKKFKQLLIQMERETGRIKIDFDFDKGNKWTIVPSRLKEMREELRPKFD